MSSRNLSSFVYAARWGTDREKRSVLEETTPFLQNDRFGLNGSERNGVQAPILNTCLTEAINI